MPQYGPPAPDNWRFAPDAPRIAAPFLHECGIWDIPTGAFLGTVPNEPDGPCEVWADGKLETSMRVAIDGSTLAAVPCEDCKKVLDLAWAPGEQRVVTLTDAPRIETWDIGTHQRLRSEKLHHEGPVVDGVVGWNDDGIVAVLEGSTTLECEYDYDHHTDCELDEDGLAIPPVVPTLSTWFWPADGSAAVEQPRRHVGAGLANSFAPPQLHHLFVVQEGTAARGTISYALLGLGLTGPDSGLSWAIPGGSFADVYETKKVDVRWRGDPNTTWISTFEHERYGDEISRFSFGYEFVALEPEPKAHRKVLFEGEFGSKVTIHRIDIAGDTLLLDWEGCPQGKKPSCVTQELAISLAKPGRASKAAGPADVALAATHDRLAKIANDRLELLDARTGTSLIRVPIPKGKAGLSPDGTKLAAIVGDDLLVWSISTGTELSRWPLASFASDVPCTDVAFDQDGAALLVGSKFPSLRIDATSGQLLGPLRIAGMHLDANAVDPSWRWVRMSDGSFFRTLDDRRLWVGVSEIGLVWAWLDDGQFEGEIHSTPTGATNLLYRIDDPPLATPRYTTTQLQRWLEHPGLARDFFGGAPLPAPRIPVVEAAALDPPP